MADPLSKHRSPGPARRRHNARQRRSPMASRQEDMQQVEPGFRDIFRKLHQISVLRKASILLIGAILGWFVVLNLITGLVSPNVWALGIDIGDIPADEAEIALHEVWSSTLRIELVDGDRRWIAGPNELGLVLDARGMVKAARRNWYARLPFDSNVAPLVSADVQKVQEYLTQLAEQVNITPVNAGYGWSKGQLTGVPGQGGRELDVMSTAQRIRQNPAEIIEHGQLELDVRMVAPPLNDPTPYMEEAMSFFGQPFELHGYDPFSDEHTLWIPSNEELASWLEASPAGLTVRESVFSEVIESLNGTVSTESMSRYLDPAESIQLMGEAISDKRHKVQLRLRHRPDTYEVVSGDTGFKIARKTGIPFFLLEDTNPSRDLSVLSPGDVLNLPSRDIMVPLVPHATKRIVVDLGKQLLVAFEDGREVFRWQISSGIAKAPTSPGIYQILSHEPVAYGSSYTLCGETGCGQWEMNWFMGISEVVPGLVNGFHGAVLLPDGGYLGGNNVGTPYTLGCVMSRDEQAKQLYDWADDGTVVEIISDEFAPKSDLARQI